MKIRVDVKMCSGHGRCAIVAPEIYKLNDVGYNEMGEFDVPAGLEVKAKEGADACPERCIAVVE